MNMTALSDETNEILTHEETIALIKRVQGGDKYAQDILVSHNLGLVRSVLKRFANRGYERDDLYQLGCIGLVKAIEKFDLSYDVRFSTYAVPMIIGEIKRFLRDDGMIKVSRSLKQTAGKVKSVKETLFKQLGREPTLQEVSEELNISKEEIVMALDSNVHPDYLYDVIHQDDGSPVHLIDKISESNVEDDSEVIDRLALREVLSKLKPRERQIIVLRYFKDKTQTEIAEILGISQVQVSRIEKKVLQQMKDLLAKT
ncbi:RNA polymerase sporulation sigma factor SigF [Geosporobacter ferrireducens]|uniref:RNA polymerase sigma-F factor n=1 Tax=Geosporobacter ferrireducens TaxID=1424294 RepID=A0A1D8GCP4_9FIRM|nr:RNA polymerase sporulation sigma factor SigF [Geosporobacter ferrireducens]AOT68666.1 RNA polymerase sigma-F factor [Geosporobacter ferrireducens]MTI54142.1 RNA polymerase sporulation sigma factor SigF [Geosporobacter ferrireducens]